MPNQPSEPTRDDIAIPVVERPVTRPVAWRWHTHPRLGLCGTLIGTILAILWVPPHNNVPGTLVVPALMMSLGLIIVPLRVLFSSPGSIF
ncbi:MAG: hypothetical protein ABL994_24625, partial [Verrucomicrobiales bacterium]